MKRFVILMFAVVLLSSCENNTDNRPPKMVLVQYNFGDTARINVNEIENYDSLDLRDKSDAIKHYLEKKLNNKITHLVIFKDDEKKK